MLWTESQNYTTCLNQANSPHVKEVMHSFLQDINGHKFHALDISKNTYYNWCKELQNLKNDIV